MRDEVEKNLARILAAYVLTFVFAVMAQKYSNFKAKAAYRLKKKQMSEDEKKKLSFNAYACEDSIAGDRCVGNWLEWAPAFLILIALNALVADGKGIEYGWVYVLGRVLYPIMALAGGIKRGGATPLIFIATAPMYAVLIYFATTVFANL